MKLRDLLGRRDKKPDCLKSFKERQESEEAFDARNHGLKEVPLDAIVGSVGRYQDFDGQFHPKNVRQSERLEEIRQAMREGKCLPPVALYQIKDEYYIMDGNHRVAAAKSLGWKTIHARILEFLPSPTTLENIIYREKIVFIEKTGIKSPINLTEVGQYAYLLQQIEEHRKALADVGKTDVSLEQAAADWYRAIYLPFVTIIENGRLLDAFPGRTLADLYAYISYHQWEKGRAREYGISLDEIIPRNMEAFRAKAAEAHGPGFPEMRRRIVAIVLINVTAGEEYQIMDRLFRLEEVKEIYDVPGEFDLIAKIEMERDWLSSDSEVMGWFVYNHIRKLEGVLKTQTLVPTTVRRK